MPSQKTSDHSNFYAHTREGQPPATWEPLYTPISQKDLAHPIDFSKAQLGEEFKKCHDMNPQHGHLNKVAYWTARFARKLGMENVAYYTGLFHDLGKFSKKFQNYLKQKEKSGGDHSTAGAYYLKEILLPNKYVSNIASIAIACHHSGLIDLLSPDGKNGLIDRFEDAENCLTETKKNVSENDFELWNLPMDCSSIKQEEKRIKDYLEENGKCLPFETGLMIRFLFSTLVDADRTATSAFYSSKVMATERNWKKLLGRFECRYKEMKEQIKKEKGSPEISRVRSSISDLCYERANYTPGIYELPLPTGSGKTLSSLRFALRHAQKYQMEQIIYILPYTTILEQNAKEARLFLEEKDFVVLEHHCNVDEKLRNSKKDNEFDPFEKFAENWDAPVIFTTMVQFLNALNKRETSEVQRLHRLAKSVIIFDEVQSLPYRITKLFTRSVNFLSTFGKSTLLLCTATQPYFDLLSRDEYSQDNLRTPKRLIEKKDYCEKPFQRYSLYYTGLYSHQDIIAKTLEKLESEKHILIILNKKTDARILFDKLLEEIKEDKIECIFLSTDLCPKHRSERIRYLKTLTHHQSKQKAICVSTNLIEAGVDLDFSVVFRALAPLDSVLQAAGRCNRHGMRERGTVYCFSLKSEHLIGPLGHIKIGAAITKDIFQEKLKFAQDQPIVLQDQDIRNYFLNFRKKINSKDENALSYPIGKQKYFRKIYSREDFIKTLLSNNKLSQKQAKNKNIKVTLCFTQSIKTASDHFEVIPDGMVPIIVPYEKGGRLIISKLKNTNVEDWDKQIFRKIQPYTVNLYQNQYDNLLKINALEPLWEDRKIYALRECNYDTEKHTGVHHEEGFLGV